MSDNSIRVVLTEEPGTGERRADAICTCGWSKSSVAEADLAEHFAREYAAKHAKRTGHVLSSGVSMNEDDKWASVRPQVAESGRNATNETTGWLFAAGLILQLLGALMLAKSTRIVSPDDFSDGVPTLKTNDWLVFFGWGGLWLGGVLILVAVIAWGVMLGMRAVRDTD